MAIVKKLLGRVPTLKGEYIPGKSYKKTNKVTRYGCEFQSMIEDNNTVPATFDSENNKIIFDETGAWKCTSNGSEAWLADNQIKSIGYWEENDEFLRVFIDEVNRFLFGIQRDGSIEWAKGVPNPVKIYIASEIKKIVGDNDIKDLMNIEELNNKFNQFLDGIEEDITLQALLDLKVNKVEGFDLIDADFAHNLHYIDNPEFVKIAIDNDGNILYAIQKDGNFLFGAGVPNQIKELYGTLVESVEWKRLYIDEEKHILFGIMQDGSIEWAKGIPTPIRNKFKAFEEMFGDTIKNINETIEVFMQTQNQQLEDFKAEINEVYGYVSDNEEYYRAYLDSENNFIWGIQVDGNVQFGKIPNQILKLYGYEIENPEYIRVIVDNDGRLIWGIDKNGEVVYGKIPRIIREALEKIDSMINSINEVFGYQIENEEFLRVYLDNQNKILWGIDKDGDVKYGKIPSQLQSLYGYVTENPEYLELKLDSKGQFIYGIRRDTGVLEYGKVPQIIQDVLEKIDEAIQTLGGVSYQDDREERMEMTLDEKNNILSYRDNEGVLHETKGLKTKLLEAENINLTDENKKYLSDVLKDMGFGANNEMLDWGGDHTDIALPIPNTVAKIEINGQFPANKYIQVPITFKYSDAYNNTFECEGMINNQGNISASFDKKNYSVDLFKSIADDISFTVRFGNWVPQDSFHLKSYYSDFWKIRSLCVYRHAEEIAQTRPIDDQRPWNPYLGYDAPKTNVQVISGGEGDLNKEIPSVPLGRPDGFPVMVWYNGMPWGLYTLNLKKSKENYNVTKNDNNAKQVFFGDYMSGVFERYNTNYWTLVATNVFTISGDGNTRILTGVNNFSPSTGVYSVMESAVKTSEGLTLTIGNYTYPVKLNDEDVSASNTWDDGDCVKFVREGSSDNYYWKATIHGQKWDDKKSYLKDEYCWDEETFDWTSNGVTSSVTIRRCFKLGISNNTTFEGYTYDSEGYPCTLSGSRILIYNTMRPLYLDWKKMEIRNPKKKIARNFIGLDEDGNPTYEYEYYNYDSPSDYSVSGAYERSHELITGDEISEAEIIKLHATNADIDPDTGEPEPFSKKEYARSVKLRKTMEEYSRALPVIQAIQAGVIPSSIWSDEWGYSTYDEAAKAIFAEHHDISHNIDFFIVYNDTNYADSITHNTLYLMYDGKHVVATIYDTDICLGMSSTYINSFGAVNTGVLVAGNTFVAILWQYYKQEIYDRYAELRDLKVIHWTVMKKLSDKLVESIGFGNYQEELLQWSQPSYRKPVYWKMNAGSLIHADGKHYYDESKNTTIGSYDEWEEGKEYVIGDNINVTITDKKGNVTWAHSFSCTAAHTATTENKPTPDTQSYTCGSPTSGGVFDSPARIVEWYKRRVAYLDYQFQYRTTRPEFTETDNGEYYYDSSLKKLIMWNGTEWVNLDGTSI